MTPLRSRLPLEIGVDFHFLNLSLASQKGSMKNPAWKSFRDLDDTHRRERKAETFQLRQSTHTIT